MHLIITPDRNTPGKKDFTGAFRPESLAYKKKWGGEIVTFDPTLSMAKRKANVLSEIKYAVASYDIDTLAFFCHGWSTGIQAGISLKDIPDLCSAISAGERGDDLKIALYCCSTGSDPQDDSEEAPGTATRADGNLGDGSFADRLRDELCGQGEVYCSVFAHRTAGHTTMNPNVVIFEGRGSTAGGYGGVMPITPKNKLVWRHWVAKLKTPYRFEVSNLSVNEIRDQFEPIA